MIEAFLSDNFAFVPWGQEHVISLFIWLVIAFLCLFLPQKYLSRSDQKKFTLLFALFICACQIGKVLIKQYLGTFDKSEDLPLHLCNILPFLILMAFYIESRTFWSVLFYWIMAGTFQSLFSPTLEHSFPHFEYHRYFIIHAGLVILALFPVFVYKWRISFTDALRSCIFLNVIGGVMYFIDILLDANYMYMIAHPPGVTIYNLLGPWPWYLISIQGLMLVLFGILTLLFYDKNKVTFQQSNP